jgi:hypothetical protein
MGNQNPFDMKLLLRVGGAGIVLALVGIGLFVLVWNALGRAGVADFPRLFASICVPPAGIAGILGLYLLIFYPSDSQSESSDQSE